VTTDPADAPARRDTLDTSRSFHVESPAGSGKTMLLTTRFVKLLAQVDHPAEILALTFTEKAAREMRTRIADALQGAMDPGPLREGSPPGPAEEELFRAAVKALHHHKDRLRPASLSGDLNIMTFHGFCHYLASRAPLEAGVNPGFSIIDDSSQSLLAAESVHRSIDRLFTLSSDDPRRRALENRILYHDNNRRALTDELVDVIRRRDRFADLVTIISASGGSDLSRFRESLENRVRFYVESRLSELAAGCLRAPLGRDWKRLRAHLSEAGAQVAECLPEELPGADWEELPAWKRLADCFLTKSGTPLKTPGPARGFYSGFVKSELGTLIRDMPSSLSRLLHDTRGYPGHDEPAVDIKTLADLVILCAAIISDYETFCKNRSRTDFTGLEYCALRVLDTTDPSDLALFLDHRLRHILIDEFQDTSRLQWELLKRLIDGWEDGGDKTVFIVGDPKQSIYGFRNAEVNLFYDAKGGIPRSGSRPLALSSRLLETNFRSRPELVEWVNQVFGTTVMKDPDTEADEVPFSPSIAGRSSPEGGSVPLSLALFAGPGGASSARADEAAWLAATAKQLVAETGGRASVGVLLFTRTHLRTYLQAFSDYGVPLQVQEGLYLADRPETGHLLQTARALARPHDDCAWASLLRSPWSWFDVSTLAEAALSPEIPWIEKLRALGRRRPETEGLLNALEAALKRIGRDPLGRVVRTFWEDLDGPRRTAARYGMGGVANCVRLCGILDDMDEGSPQETLERFEALLETFYEPVDPTTARSPIHMMTIHRAKGLEFDMVLLPFMDWNPLSGGISGPPPYLVERLPGKKEEHLIATGRDRRKPDPDPLYRILSRLERHRKTGEAKRLFYVAATRARSRLIMSGITGLKQGNPVTPRMSPLSWVWTHHGGQEGLMPEWPGRPPAVNAGIAFEINPAPPEMPDENSPVALFADQMPAVPDIQPEHRTLSVKTPSAGNLDTDAGPDTARASREEDLYSIPAIRGMLIHRLLRRGLEGKGLPGEGAVTDALVREGVPREEAFLLTPGILEETRATLDSPFIATLLEKAVGPVRTEWKLESALSPSSLLSGSIDLALFDGTCWWIIDFKTGTPGTEQDMNLFFAIEEERYRSQIGAYRRLLKCFIEPESTPVRAGIFFTAPGVWRELCD